MKQKTAGLIVAVALMTVGCQQKTSGIAQKAGTGEVVAKVGDIVITTGEISNELNKQSPFIRARYSTPEKKKEYVENMIKLEVLALEAMRRGLDKDPDVQKTLKKIMVQKLTQQEIDAPEKGGKLGEAELKGFYDDNHADYHKPEMRRISHILTKTQAEAQGLIRTLNQKKKELNAFRNLAREKTLDQKTKNKGGDLQYLSQEDANTKLFPAAAVAIFKLTEVGGMTGPLKGEDGWHIFKLTGKRPAINRSFDQVKSQIQSRMKREYRTRRYEEFVEGLKKKVKITINEGALAKIEVKAPAPPMKPGRNPHQNPHGRGPGRSAHP